MTIKNSFLFLFLFEKHKNEMSYDNIRVLLRLLSHLLLCTKNSEVVFPRKKILKKPFVELLKRKEVNKNDNIYSIVCNQLK